jgi:hypothetical protein
MEALTHWLSSLTVSEPPQDTLQCDGVLHTEAGFVKKVLRPERPERPSRFFIENKPQKCFWFEGNLPSFVEEGSYVSFQYKNLVVRTYVHSWVVDFLSPLNSKTSQTDLRRRLPMKEKLKKEPSMCLFLLN